MVILPTEDASSTQTGESYWPGQCQPRQGLNMPWTHTAPLGFMHFSLPPYEERKPSTILKNNRAWRASSAPGPGQKEKTRFFFSLLSTKPLRRRQHYNFLFFFILSPLQYDKTTPVPQVQTRKAFELYNYLSLLDYGATCDTTSRGEEEGLSTLRFETEEVSSLSSVGLINE